MIKLTIENESITSFQHFEIWGFILTMRNVNDLMTDNAIEGTNGFILTMRNVNFSSVYIQSIVCPVLY